MRKNWKKELQNLDTPINQIARIRSLLRDLGMSGRMSMEQAKAIKAKREFDQEMSASANRYFMCILPYACCIEDILDFAGKHSTDAANNKDKNDSENDSDAKSELSEDNKEASGPSKHRQKVSEKWRYEMHVL